MAPTADVQRSFNVHFGIGNTTEYSLKVVWMGVVRESMNELSKTHWLSFHLAFQLAGNLLQAADEYSIRSHGKVVLIVTRNGSQPLFISHLLNGTWWQRRPDEGCPYHSRVGIWPLSRRYPELPLPLLYPANHQRCAARGNNPIKHSKLQVAPQLSPFGLLLLLRIIIQDGPLETPQLFLRTMRANRFHELARNPIGCINVPYLK